MKEKITKDELDHFIETLKRLILDLEISISNIEAIIVESKSNPEKIYLINDFLGHYVYLAYTYSALNVYKIFKDEEKRSFKKLFNKLENFQYSEDLKKVLEDNKTDDDNKDLFTNKDQIKIELVKLKEAILNVQTIVDIISNRRNTFYAHYDPNKKFPPESLDDLKTIKETAKQVFDKLYGRFYGKNFFFSNHIWTINPVLESSKFCYDYNKDLEDNLDNED